MEEDESYYAYHVEMIKCHLLSFSGFLIISVLITSCGHIPKNITYEDPLTAEEHNNLGVAYENEGKLDLALKEYKKSVDKDSNLITPLVNIGNIYLKKMQYDQAEKYYLKVLDMDKYNINAANNIANLYLQTNKDYTKGIQLLTIALNYQEQPLVHAMDTLSELYIRTGQLSKAEKILNNLCIRVLEDEVYKAVEKKQKLIGNDGCS